MAESSETEGSLTESLVTDDMRSIVGAVMRESTSHPVVISDIRKWAIAVYYPEPHHDNFGTRTTPLPLSLAVSSRLRNSIRFRGVQRSHR